MQRKKHILFVSSWYPNRNNPTHGIFNQCFADAASLYNKISVLHVCSDANQTRDFEFEENAENGIYTVIVYYKKISGNIPVFSQIKKRSTLLKAFDLGYEKIENNAGRPDLIQLNVVMPAGLGVMKISGDHNIPYIVNEGWSGYAAEDGNYKGAVLKYFTSKIIAGAKKIMPTSEYLKKAMIKHGLEGDYEVVPNVVNVNLFTAQPLEFSTITRFIHVSSLNDREKNVSGIIRAFAMALKNNNEMFLTIVGEGEGKKELHLLVDRLQLKSKIKFSGRLLGAELVASINAHDALIMFSNYETFSLVIVEAFACGKPVITSNAGAIESYMTPGLGIMVQKKNEAQLTSAIIEMAATKRKYDPAYIRQVAVEDYSYEKVGEKLTAIYEEVIRASQI